MNYQKISMSNTIYLKEYWRQSCGVRRLSNTIYGSGILTKTLAKNRHELLNEIIGLEYNPLQKNVNIKG